MEIAPNPAHIQNTSISPALLSMPQTMLPPSTLESNAAAPASGEETAALATIDEIPETPQPGVSLSDLPDHLAQLPLRLELRVTLDNFTLRALQTLSTGALLHTDHPATRDVVLTAAGERLLLGELEATEQHLAVRVKRLI